jgi:hypothetical protein
LQVGSKQHQRAAKARARRKQVHKFRDLAGFKDPSRPRSSADVDLTQPPADEPPADPERRDDSPAAFDEYPANDIYPGALEESGADDSGSPEMDGAEEALSGGGDGKTAPLVGAAIPKKAQVTPGCCRADCDVLLGAHTG